MSLVNIEIVEGKSEQYKKSIMDGVHNALIEAIKIPDWNRFQKLYELDEENFEVPEKYSENAIIIGITLFKGRSFEAKKKLYSLITDNLAASPGIKKEDVMIVLHEVPLENWGINGGQPANEVDIGFNTEHDEKTSIS